MIHIHHRDLPRTAQQNLRRFQAEIDGIPDFIDRVKSARSLFASRNRPDNATFRHVRDTLSQMCSGARRCGYCEDSAADEVEHIKPKHFFPEVAFVWQNYLYACGPCNGPKGNNFAIFSDKTGELIDLTYESEGNLNPPEAGRPVLIDPRMEDPLEFMELDLIDTFFFIPIESISTNDYRRAQYTIDLLRLNDRDHLLAAREEAYRNYKARLCEYIARRYENAPPYDIEVLVTSIKRMGHPSVWVEMKRKHRDIDELAEMFVQVPEALEW